MKEQILQYKQTHPDWGYKRIAKEIGCAPNTVKYYLDPKAKDVAQKRCYRYREINPLCQKLGHFREIREKKKAFDKLLDGRRSKAESLFTTKDLLIKFGENPRCYLTGEPINLDAIETYEFDHIKPVAQGGNNSLENLGLCLRDINRAKQDKTPEEFIEICKRVLTHHGYRISWGV